ncbi:neuroparsin-like peptide precursor [Nasonia vitripennis]|uniref:Neuroparsin-A n=1 Tax=Nasonia vitripennis TaxID=7425 RepID=A0A7M6UVJ5_NASVI|nr:neuroparsin-like peptide precursor [Nasonia vitripennis]
MASDTLYIFCMATLILLRQVLNELAGGIKPAGGTATPPQRPQHRRTAPGLDSSDQKNDVLSADRFLGHPTIIERAVQRSECEGCGANCKQCKYGSAYSLWCGLDECLKGPGEMCGGVRNKYGECGDGMYCRCNKCTGCSIDTLECFSGFCPILEQQMQLRHQDHSMHGLQLDK